MPRKKLTRFNLINTFTNVFQTPENFSLENLKFEKLILEVGCGKGDYTIQLAKQNPENTYIGFDKKGERIWRGATQASDYNLPNALFIRGDAAFLQDYFPESCIDEIWITFPGPFPKSKHENRRLVSPPFLERYSKIIKQDHVIHLKTDDLGLFNYAKEILTETVPSEIINCLEDIYSLPEIPEILKIQTDFEKKHLAKGKTINYLAFKLKKS